MKKLLLLLSLIISGCGGGGDTSPTNNVTTVSTVNPNIQSIGVAPIVNAAPVLLFDSTPQLLPDLRAKYDKLCNNRVSVQFVSSANLIGHKDGKKDLVFSLWCTVDDSARGLLSTLPVINGMVVFIQQNNGDFIDGTQTIFHTDMVDIGGNGGDVVIYDFNNDGYDDIVWGTTPEDGRLEPEYYTGNYIQKVFMTSDGIGGYTIQKLGLFTKTNKLQLIDNEVGGKDVVSTFMGYFGYPEVWRYSNGWKLISGYDWISNSLNLFFKRKSINDNSHQAISMSNTSLGLELRVRKDNLINWVKTDVWNFTTVQIIPVIHNNTNSQTNLVKINNKDYIDPSFESGCELKRKSNEDSIAIVLFTGAEIISGYKGGTLYKNYNDLRVTTKIVAFSTLNDKLTKIDINIIGEITNVNVLKIDCIDTNNDGTDDIIITPIGKNAIPVIYLNDGLGNFSLVDTSKFPSPSSDYFDTSMSFVDIDGNGTKDLLYFPANRLVGNPSKVQYQLYKGKRLLNFLDLASQN